MELDHDPPDWPWRVADLIADAESVVAYERARAEVIGQWPTWVLQRLSWAAVPDHVVRVAYRELERRRAAEGSA